MNTAQQNAHQSSYVGGSDIINYATVASGVRKCWATARERNRMKARYAIQQRVFCETTIVTVHGNDDVTVTQHDVSSSTGRHTSMNFHEKIPRALHRIIRGDTSYFSLQFMEEHFRTLNDPFPSQLLWETNSDVANSGASDLPLLLLDTVRLRSRLGRENVSRLECYVTGMETFTILEYAVWLKRYRIIRQLIVGGIDPIHCRSAMLSDEQNHRTKEISIRIRQLFLSGVVPLSLSSYVVSRVIGLRQSTWDACQTLHVESLSSSQVPGCMICGVTTDLLLFLSPLQNYEDPCPSHHQFCEVCIWNDILQHLDNRVGDVVQCPICHHHKKRNNMMELAGTDQKHPFTPEVNEIRAQLFKNSVAKYNALPKDSSIIKQLTSKKKNPPECDTTCSTWSEAVRPSIGMTQTSRRDKFFHFIDKGSFHHVKACIDQGMDLNVQNEYGQTAFFIAVWQNDVQLVRLLLNHGCDPSIVANGEVSPYNVANVHGYEEILDLLNRQFGTNYICDKIMTPLLSDETYCVMRSSLPSFTSLIDFSVDHPGAGSFIIDNFLDDFFVDFLFGLWKLLPVEDAAKKKLGPCSERRYYCDAHHTITKAISAVAMTAVNTIHSFPFTQVVCGPQMRFLNYSESGAVLAPHIDLSRTDPSTTQRSTHSFLLYLSTCIHGGETALLGAVTGDARNQYLATVAPKRGRILIFPHRCPHEGLAVVDVPKLLIRGELWMS